MPKSKAANNVVVQIGQSSLVDAAFMGKQVGFTGKYVSQLARAGKIPWVGVCNGVKVYRRYDVEAVLAALAHGVEASDGDDTQPEVARRSPHGVIRSAGRAESAAHRNRGDL